MAEAIGTIASVYTIAEAALKVGSTLWKLGKDLKGAGNEAREVSKYIRLIAKTLKQICTKFESRASIQDLSLVEDLVSVCEDRLAEAGDLVKALEDEMIKGKTNGRLFLLRLKFVFEKSKFALLQRDLDSLQMTLQLVVETITFEQSYMNGQATQELREELEHLKDAVEQDIMDRQTNSIVQLALSLGESNPMAKSAQLTQSEDVADLDDDPVSARKSEAAEVAVVTQTFTQLDFSKSLVLFAQTQLVQKKAIRRADLEIKKPILSECEKTSASEIPYRPPYEASHERSSTATNEDSFKPKLDSEGPALSPTATNISGQTENSPSHQDTRAVEPRVYNTQSPSKRPSQPYFPLIPDIMDKPIQAQDSEASVNSFSPDNSRMSFSILDITGQKHRYPLSRLDEISLPNLILEANRALIYLPPKKAPSSHMEMFPHTGTIEDRKDETSYFMENSFYSPPPRASISGRFSTLASRAGIRHGVVDIGRDQLWGRYVLEYAKWHTCQAMYKELERKAYFLVNMTRISDWARPVIRGHINEVDMTKSMSLVHCTNWEKCVEPSAVVAVAFDIRSFDRTDMFDTGFTDFGHVLDDDLYINDLRALKPPGGQNRLFSNIASAGPRLPW